MDEYYSGGGTSNSSSAINTSNVANPAPQSVYQTQRYGYTTYTIPGLTPAAPYTVRLHFAETVYTATGAREFNASINGVQVLTNFDIVATAGGPNIAVVEQFPAAANSSGQIVVYMSAGAVDGPTISGIEIVTNFQLDSGGGNVGTWTGDKYYNGGGTSNSTATINTSAVSNPAPQSVYQTQRYGYTTYTIPNLTANATYYVRLHFAETTWTSAGQREFNASINGVQVLTNFDIIANAGAPNTAITETFSTTANSSGQIVIYLSAGAVDGPTISGFEILSPASSFALSGQVTYNGAALSGATIALSGSSSGTYTTNSSGNYSIAVTPGGNYTITASKSGYQFSPASAYFPDVTTNAAQNFTATAMQSGPYQISGYVLLGGSGPSANSPVSGAVITLSGSQSGTTTSATNGSWSFTVAGGNYTVSASLPHYSVSGNLVFSSVVSNVQGNFTATYVSGGSFSPSSPDKEYIFMNGAVVTVEHPH